MVEAPELATHQQSIEQQMNRLIDSGASVSTIARLLGGEQYVEVQTRGKNTTTIFHVRAFMDAFGEAQLQLPTQVRRTAKVMVPPDALPGPRLGVNPTEPFEAKRSIPRTVYTMEVLSDLGWPYTTVEGGVTEEMMRREPYHAFLLRQQHTIILVCNESDNVSFILRNVHGDVEPFLSMSKSELKALPEYDAAGVCGRPLTWCTDIAVWKGLLRRAIVTPLEQLPQSKMYGEKAASELLGISRNVLRREALTHPQPGIEVTQRGQQEHYRYSEDFLIQFASERAEVLPAPTDWLTIGELEALLITTTRQFIEAELGRVESADPTTPQHDTFRARTSGRAELHLTPEFCRRIITLDAQRVSPPPLWIPYTALGDELGIDGKTLLKALAAVQADFTDQIKPYTVKGRKYPHLGPDLSQAIRQWVRDTIGESVTGLHNIFELGTITGFSSERIEGIMAELDPAGKQVRKRKVGKNMGVYLEAGLEVQVRARLEQLKLRIAPVGWLTVPDIARLTEVDPDTAKKYAGRLFGDSGSYQKKLHPKSLREFDYLPTTAANQLIDTIRAGKR